MAQPSLVHSVSPHLVKCISVDKKVHLVNYCKSSTVRSAACITNKHIYVHPCVSAN